MTAVRSTAAPAPSEGPSRVSDDRAHTPRSRAPRVRYCRTLYGTHLTIAGLMTKLSPSQRVARERKAAARRAGR